MTVLENRWIPLDPAHAAYHAGRPSLRQAEFLCLPHREALYGGAAGGGKSDALLMAALQYVDVPGYAALILRRSYADLALPDAIMDRAHAWLRGTGVHWNQDTKTYTFPSGATLSFGYLQHAGDKYRYQGAAFQYIGWDELTQFREEDYRYLFSRLRRREAIPVPLRIRAASNPGGLGHEWVHRRFIVEGEGAGRPFVPALLDDNPGLDREGYLRSLATLDPTTRRQLQHGDWSARAPGTKFQRAWFRVVPEVPPGPWRWVRFWDLAATEPSDRNRDPDWAVGGKVGFLRGQWCVADVRRIRARPKAVEDLVRQTAEVDGRGVPVRIEQEPGASGVNTIDHYQRTVLPGWDVRGVRADSSKETRANPVSAAAEAGNVCVVSAPWVTAFLDEFEAFPTEGVHDDQVDVVSGAFRVLTSTSAPDVAPTVITRSA